VLSGRRITWRHGVSKALVRCHPEVAWCRGQGRHERAITFQPTEMTVPRGLLRQILADIAARTMLGIDTMAAISRCQRKDVPEGGCLDLKFGRAGEHRIAATLPAVLRLSKTLPGDQTMPIVHKGCKGEWSSGKCRFELL
jgi:hypothetical protein